ncbi:MAG TPA: lipoyl(octanoyl) transferase LipB [Terriglobales bacterium]|nr:lipoyl(octanoyl) transferase LipB [Terriglobales bacterium]
MIAVVQLGMVDYTMGLELQQSLVELRKAEKISDTMLLLEHPGVITLGRNAKRQHVLASEELLKSRGVAVVECDRGGDVTFHGPGQLVGYPIFDLRAFTTTDGQRKTLGAVDYVRRLEEVLIRTCAEFSVAAGRIPGVTGVWTEGPHPAKVAAIGVHISRGVTSHGFALNVSTDMESFELIVPCGLKEKSVTSLNRETSRTLDMQEVCESVTRNFGRVFQRQIVWVDTLDALLGRAVDVPMKAPEAERRIAGEEQTFQG